MSRALASVSRARTLNTMSNCVFVFHYCLVLFCFAFRSGSFRTCRLHLSSTITNPHSSAMTRHAGRQGRNSKSHSVMSDAAFMLADFGRRGVSGSIVAVSTAGLVSAIVQNISPARSFERRFVLDRSSAIGEGVGIRGRGRGGSGGISK